MTDATDKTPKDPKTETPPPPAATPAKLDYALLRAAIAKFDGSDPIRVGVEYLLNQHDPQDPDAGIWEQFASLVDENKLDPKSATVSSLATNLKTKLASSKQDREALRQKDAEINDRFYAHMDQLAAMNPELNASADRIKRPAKVFFKDLGPLVTKQAVLDFLPVTPAQLAAALATKADGTKDSKKRKSAFFDTYGELPTTTVREKASATSPEKGTVDPLARMDELNRQLGNRT